MPVSYEWAVETMDGPGDEADIQDVNHENTYALAKSVAKGIEHVRIGLVRDVWDKGTRSLTARSWAYIDGGVLPEYFEDAGGSRTAKVPKKYVEQVAWELVETLTDQTEIESFDPPRRYRVSYPKGVEDDYGHTVYWLATKRGAMRVAMAALATLPGQKFCLFKDF